MGISKLSQEDWEELLRGVMAIERRYGFDKKNVTSTRRAEIREHIEKFSASRLEASQANEA